MTVQSQDLIAARDQWEAHTVGMPDYATIQGATIIMVTHNMEPAKSSYGIWYMRDGNMEKEVVRHD